jgi:predicted RNA-binding Zn-ribbon protein involved in translation (DUF1610 family)
MTERLTLSEVARLSCPSCGAPLEVSPDICQFACRYCSSTIERKEKGGLVFLVLIEKRMRAVEEKQARTTEQIRLIQEIADLEKKVAETRKTVSFYTAAGFVLAAPALFLSSSCVLSLFLEVWREGDAPGFLLMLIFPVSFIGGTVLAFRIALSFSTDLKRLQERLAQRKMKMESGGA